MSGVVSHADWVFAWRLPLTGSLAGGGLIVQCAQYKGDLVLLEGSSPFAIVPYHDGSYVFKDGLNAQASGVPFAPLLPTAPDLGWSSAYAATEADAVVIEKNAATLIAPAMAAVWCKVWVGNYQYIQRWEFHRL